MSRSIAGKVVVECTLETKTPLCVGGAGAGSDVDLTLAVDGRGMYYVPGSSLMGPMRTWIERNLVAGKPLAEALCGFQSKDEGQASWLLVEDTPVTLPKDLSEEIRHGIRIDRATGTIREGFFFTRAVLPRGSTITLLLELDLPADPIRGGGKDFFAVDFEAALRLLLEDVHQNGLRLGSARTRGLGRLELEGDFRISRYDFPDATLSDSAGLFAWLKREPRSGLQLTDLGSGSSVRKRIDIDHLVITIGWKPLSPVMSKSGFDGVVADSLPLVSGVANGTVAPVLPGSGIKGVLRSHAARVVRTVLKKPLGALEKGESDPDGDFPIISDLFGDTTRSGRLSVADVYQIQNTVNASAWRREAKQEMEKATTWEDHVAIDRFTGGSVQGRLFSARTPRTDREWEPIRIELDLDRGVPPPIIKPEESTGKEAEWPHLSKETRRLEVALLFFVLRDLEAGLVPLGFGVNRGMGDVIVEGVAMKGQVGGLPIVTGGSTPGGFLDELPHDLREDLNDAWTRAKSNDFRVEPEGTPQHPERSGEWPVTEFEERP